MYECAAALDPLHAQTPQAAEHEAARHALQHASRGAAVLSDQGVVNGVASRGDAERLLHGGMVMATRRRSAALGVSVCRIKAHASESGLEGWALFAARVNNIDDRLANVGRKLAAPPHQQALVAAAPGACGLQPCCLSSMIS